MGTDAVVARAAPHYDEEPCISGTRGTGAVFFSGCSLGCAYCQNYKISRGGAGAPVTVRELTDLFIRLEDQGVHSISLVTAAHFTHAVLDALALYQPKIPIIWNSGGYELPETLALLAGAVDIYLPDIKHVSPRLSTLLCGAPDYFERASAALVCMRKLTGAENVYDENGLLTRGVLARHLVLPGCTGDSQRALSFLAEALPGTPVSVMRQYTPIPECRVPGMDRRVTDKEYARVLAHARALGLSGYWQGADSATLAFTPAFDGTGV